MHDYKYLYINIYIDMDEYISVDMYWYYHCYYAVAYVVKWLLLSPRW